MLASILLYLGFNSFLILRVWKQLIQRNKLLFIYTTGFVVAILGMLWGSAFNYYSNSGPNLLLAVVACNLYAYLLVYLLMPQFDSQKETIRYLRNTEINQGVHLEYERLPLPIAETELLNFQPEERIGAPRRQLFSLDGKRPEPQRGLDDSNDYTMDGDDERRLRQTSTGLQDRATLSPQEPVERSDNDPNKKLF